MKTLEHGTVFGLDVERRGDPTFRRLLGAAAWRRLAPAIRLRFSAKPSHRTPLRYDGHMLEVRCSRAGWLLAQACRLIGTPFAPFQGRDVPTEVEVYPENGGEGLVWRRRYRFPGRTATVYSVKRPDAREGLLECVGAGFGMTLAVFERDGALHFLSRRYFWQLGRWRLTLPGLLTPGTTHVVHTDHGDGSFSFTMAVRHPWLGETFFQDGRFRAAEGI
jgi:hypothetical protein